MVRKYSIQFSFTAMNRKWNVGSGCHASNIATYNNCHIRNKWESFLTKDETGLEAPNPLTLHYQRDLNLRLRISCSFARSCADHLRAFSSYFWVRWTRLAEGRRSSDTCAVHAPSHRSLWWCSCSMTDMFLGPKTLRLTSVLLILCSHQILPILRRQRWSNIVNIDAS